ncbi:MAG: hypothetical protein ACMUIG_06615 [Thermoplasmatota archaeon]
MSGYRLSDREAGAHFCRFERELIFDDSRADTGWVRYISKNVFKLMKSRFTDIHSGRVYLLPESDRGPAEGDFIEIEPGTEEKKIVIKGAGRRIKPGDFESYRVINVDRWTEGRIVVPPPLLPRDEFLFRVSREWRNAPEDMLDTVIALLMVSAPPSIFGRGGVGSEGLEALRMTSIGSPRDVARSIMTNLPLEFRVPGSSVYKYMPLGSARDVASYRSDRSSEGNFTIVKPHRITDAWLREKLPIQLPFVLIHSEYRKEKATQEEFDLDVLDYQLSALYLPPPKPEDVEAKVKKTMERAYRSEFFDLGGFGEPDPLGGAKLQLALGRLNIGREWKGRKYVRRSFLGMDKGDDLFERLLRRGYQEVRERRRDESFKERDRSLPGREKLKDRDRRIYFLLRRRAEENGIFETPREEILPGENQMEVQESLDRLNKYGYILYMKGGIVIKVVTGLDNGP